MISEEQIEQAIEYLRNSAKEAGVARAQARTLKKYLEVVEAKGKVTAQASGMTNAAARDVARASPEYKMALDGLEEAVKRDSEFKMLREAAQSRIEAWRTMCSNARAEGKAYS